METLDPSPKNRSHLRGIVTSCENKAKISTGKDSNARKNVEELSALIVDCGYRLHVDLGPGLLETVYEAVLTKMIDERGVHVQRQVPVPIQFMGLKFDEGFRADLIVDNLVVVELKSVEHLAPVHSKQLLTYLRLLKMPLGLLINFGAATFKEGVKRILNGPQSFVSSRLRVNQMPEDAR